jgi:hypothetical protein
VRAISILDQDSTGTLAVDLISILNLLGPRAAASEWEIRDLECAIPELPELCRLSETEEKIPGDRLLRLAREAPQIIDGSFKGYMRGQDKPWVIIRAVDSSAYDVETNDDELLSRIRQKFRQVVDYPEVE